MFSADTMSGMAGVSTSHCQKIICNSHGTPMTPTTPTSRPRFHPPSILNPFQQYFNSLPSATLDDQDVKEKDIAPEPKAGPGQVLVYRGGKLVIEEMEVDELDEVD